MNEYDFLNAQIYYRMAQIDMQEILLQMKTAANRDLIIEINERFAHCVQLRLATKFADTQEESA